MSLFCTNYIVQPFSVFFYKQLFLFAKHATVINFSY
jgi:hypothetical protein